MEYINNDFDEIIWEQLSKFKSTLDELIATNMDYMQHFINGRKLVNDEIINSATWRMKSNANIQNLLKMYYKSPVLLLFPQLYRHFVQPTEAVILKFCDEAVKSKRIQRLLHQLDKEWNTVNGLPKNDPAITRFNHLFHFTPMLKPYYPQSFEIAYGQLFKCLIKQQNIITDNHKEWTFVIKQWNTMYFQWSKIIEKFMFKWRADNIVL